jgi:multimeric flavodoxin WrbA
MTTVRKGQWSGFLTREAFGARFRGDFFDPAFDAEQDAIARLEEIAWQAYRAGRKAPRTGKAGPGFDDPDYELSVEWSETRLRLLKAEAQQKNPGSKSRVLVVNASSRNDGTCPGEVSKTFRLATLVRETLAKEDGVVIDFIDLSELNSDFGKHIHPCKGCVSTAMPLCHWPCSCYPNHALGQVNDWMAEIYERWVAAHGVIICSPVYWYQMPSPLKLMCDRLVCADGGNPDPTTTSGKDPEKAKALEERGWSYPKHLQGRVYGLVVHGDVAGIEGSRRALSDWLDWMGLIDSGVASRLDRYIGYYKPYATSHEELDADAAFQEEVRNVARAVANAVELLRAGNLSRPDAVLRAPRPK